MVRSKPPVTSADPPRLARRSTIQDVADLAGVTKATVSKFLNAAAGGYYVKAETRERIEAAIQELKYEPNAIARGLTINRTMTIGLIAADIRNPFYPDLVAGVQRVVERSGYTLVLGSSGADAKRERAIVRSMIRRRVDGVILGSARMHADEIGAFIESGTRLVLASRNLPEPVTDTVIVDNRRGAEMAVDHLVDLGHRRIAHIAGPQDVMPFRDRLIGYRAALIRRGIEIDDSLVVASTSDPAAGAAAATTMLQRADRPTAIFAGNDNMALGVMDSVRKQGDLCIPTDVSVIGFDDIALASNSIIALTTIDSLAGRLGEEAASLLVERLSASTSSRYSDLRMIVHEPILRVRGTTAAPRG